MEVWEFQLLFQHLPLAGKEGYAMLVMMCVTIGVSYILYKSGVVKLNKVEK